MSDWPAIGFEFRDWSPTTDPDLLSRRQREIYRGPYEAAVLPAIAESPLRLSGESSADAEEAATALARFDAEIGALSVPFAAILLRSESASSSEIEQLTSGARAIAEAELGERDTGNAALIVRNVRALQAALDRADHLDAEGIIAMQEALLGAHAPDLTGRFRAEQVWIGGGSIGPHRAAFVPPHHDRISAVMDDLLAFIAREDLPVLAQTAIAHAQFETIHPFPDGNGRTGRAIVQAMLRQKGLTKSVTIPVSAGLLHDIDGYFAALESYRQGEVAPIVGSFSRAALHAVGNGWELARDIEAIKARWQVALQSLRRDAVARRVADLAFAHPVVNQSLVVSRLEIPPLSAYRALDALAERGVLKQANSKKRNRLWVATDVIEALDDFAARAGRRRRA